MTSLNRARVPAGQSQKTLIHSDAFKGFSEPRSPRKRDRMSLADLMNPKPIAFALEKAHELRLPGARPNNAIEIDDDDDEEDDRDNLEEFTPSPVRGGDDQTRAWIMSPDKGLSREGPTLAARNARALHSMSVEVSEHRPIDLDSVGMASSVAKISGKSSRQNKDAPKVHYRDAWGTYRDAVRSPSPPNRGIVDEPIAWEDFEFDDTNQEASPITGSLAEPSRRNPGSRDRRSQIEDSPAPIYDGSLQPNGLLSDAYDPTPAPWPARARSTSNFTSPLKTGSAVTSPLKTSSAFTPPVKTSTAVRGDRLASASMSSPTKSPNRERTTGSGKAEYVIELPCPPAPSTSLPATDHTRINGVDDSRPARWDTGSSVQIVQNGRPLPRGRRKPDARSPPVVVVRDTPEPSNGPGTARAKDIASWSQNVEINKAPSIVLRESPEPAPQRSSGSRLNRWGPEDKVEDRGGQKRKADAPLHTARPMPKRPKLPPVAVVREVEDFPMSLPAPRERMDLSTQAKAIFNELDDEVEETASESELDLVEVSDVPQLQLRGRQAAVYCRKFVGRDTCTYCPGSEALPAKPTAYLLELESKLAAIRATGGQIRWDQRADYCARHKAETETFPLGLQAGYPARVDFRSVYHRVMDDRMTKAILKIIDHPRDHPAFVQCKREIGDRYQRWSGERSAEKSLSKSPG